MITNIIRYNTLVTECLSDVLSNFIYLCINFINEAVWLDLYSEIVNFLENLNENNFAKEIKLHKCDIFF